MDYFDGYQEVKRLKCECGGYLIPFATYLDAEEVKDWSGKHSQQFAIFFRMCARCLKLEKIRLGANPELQLIAEGINLNKVYFLCQTWDGKPQYWPQGFAVEGEPMIGAQEITDPKKLGPNELLRGGIVEVVEEWLSVPQLLDFLIDFFRHDNRILEINLEAKRNLEGAVEK